MSEHKNTVEDLSELKGWREPGEELKYLQGALLDNLKHSKRGTAFVNIILGGCATLCFAGVVSILEFVFQNANTIPFVDGLLFAIIVILLVLGGFLSAKTLIKSMEPTEERLMKQVKNADFSVCDATIRDIHYIHSTNGSDITLANLEDREGNYCKDSISCDWTRWLKVGSHVYLTCYKVKEGKYFYRIYPSISNGENQDAYQYGMKLYKKHFK